ncbi:RNA polymerase sigma-70 factor (ECF subfamily) [Larkinella arboricola]|uniref:RNA polymerase sigma-70 factor (ECF subfamily) n=1 Tax=Larkinella arboricola TaxID=643671 RepID=A0A327X8E4_LARAB|nr:RNA polymerase sigma-70 factor [Larkinella arboricola]RAK02959.1 RNA polymerase sigma-70 factor (ECF subfamily) [Larkinella arboricola]
MDYSILSDVVLVKLLQAGDTTAFQTIYRKYWQPLLAVARKKLYSQENAEELVQDLFVDLWERRGTIQIDDLKKYLFGAVKYKVLNHIKALLIRQKYEDFKNAKLADLDCHTEEVLAYNDLNKALETGIAHLPDKTRQIFRLNRLENQSVRQISASLRIPERTVEYHIMQSLRSLRSHLKDYVGVF